MLALVSPSSLSLPISSTDVDMQSSMLDTKVLPDGVIVMYLYDTLASVSGAKTSETCRYAFISFLNNLDTPTTQLPELIKNRQICALHVQNGVIKSLTLTSGKLKLLAENKIEEIAIFYNNRAYLIKEDIIVRPFASDAQYARYTSDLI